MNSLTSVEKLRQTLYTTLFTALIAVTSLFVIPIGPVPVTLQTLFVLLSGLMLGARQALISCLLYILCGLIGLPVFAGGKAGFSVLMGPTSGFLLAFPLGAWVAGTLNSLINPQKTAFKAFLAVTPAWLLIYVIGLTRMSLVLHRPWTDLFFIAVLPFLFADTIKAIVAALLYRQLKPYSRF